MTKVLQTLGARLALLLLFSIKLLGAVHDADICVYGGTASGVVAAVQAARMGKAVALVEPGAHLGGMTSGGLSQTDIGNKAAIGGIAREFYQLLGKHYRKEEAWTFEPGVAERAFNELAREAGVKVFLHQPAASVKMLDHRLVELTTTNGDSFHAAMFIDTSYEGDLMALAGVSFTVGREANTNHAETLNGIRARTPKHQFLDAVDPYTHPGDPASGLLPLVQAGELGEAGAGDHRVQAYNFRLCLTQTTTNRLPIQPPKNYDPARFELLARYLEAVVARGGKPALGEFMHIQIMPNGKTDINNNGGFSTDFIGGNYDYPNARHAERARIWEAHENYTRGFLHFLATSPRVPETMRKEMQSWGLCRDEFPDTGGWPHQLYVREARRMVSDYVMTEHNCVRSLALADSIGLAAYTMDSHNCQRVARAGRVENEGDVQVGGFPPYPIAYRALVPRASECGNLLVPVCLSASHIAYGSIRMEPVFMVLGQSAATAAVQAMETRKPVQKIDLKQLQDRLRADKQVLVWPPPATAIRP